MIIIVEGIDRVGKSTLINDFIKQTNLKCSRQTDSNILKACEIQNKYETDKTLKILKLCNQFYIDIIFDRLFWTDYVYGIIERNYDVEEANKNFDLIEEELLKNDSLIILVNPTDIKSSSEQHNKDLTTYQKMFKELSKRSKIKVIECDYNSINKTVKLMKDFVNEKMNLR